MTDLAPHVKTFVEPTRALSLSWGSYNQRLALALALLYLGPAIATEAIIVSFLGGSTYLSTVSVPQLVVGYLIFICGWLVLPAKRGRRAAASLAGVVSLLMYFHSIGIPFGGLSQAAGLAGGGAFFFQGISLSVVVVAWLFVRQRSGLTYLVVPLVFILSTLLSAIPFPPSWGAGSPAATAGFLASWILLIGGSTSLARYVVEPRITAARSRSRVDVSSPTTGVGAEQRLSVYAVLSLVFAFVVAPLGVVFGHVALVEIRRTQDRGRGLAIAGLVIGYAWTLGIILIVVIAATLHS